MNNLEQIIQYIEHNHAIMDAQIARLGKMPHGVNLPSFNGIEDVSTLLKASLFNQIQGASQTLEALEDVQISFAENHRSIAETKGLAEVIIDTEFTERTRRDNDQV